MTGQNGRRIAEPERVSINDGYGTSFPAWDPPLTKVCQPSMGITENNINIQKTKCVVIVIGWDPFFNKYSGTSICLVLWKTPMTGTSKSHQYTLANYSYTQ